MSENGKLSLGGYQITTFANIPRNASFEVETSISEEKIFEFALLTRDSNPLHNDLDFGNLTPFGQITAQGQLMSSLIVGVIGSQLPGPGWFCLGVNSDFIKPCFPGDEVIASVKVKQKIKALHIIIWDCFLKRKVDNTILVRAIIKTKCMY